MTYRFRTMLGVMASVTALPLTARAAEYFVAPGGSGTTCSMAAPCGRVDDAQTLAVAGDTVWIRGGTYRFAATATVGVNFNKSGSSNNPIRYFAYMNEIPVFDLSNGTPNGRVTGLNVQCDWIHLRGLEVAACSSTSRGRIRGACVSAAPTTSSSA